MGTEYSMRMENMVDGLQARVKELEAERDAALAEVERLRAASRMLLTETMRSRKGSIGGIDTHYIVQLRCDQVDTLFAALNPAPELWPCGHEKVRHDEVCRECSP